MINLNGVPNRLIHEKSPYLLQHAYNPVEWYPWSEEAFKKAKIENRPIFLSIGYSTCHWCHVMAHESFEDVEVAKQLNDFFVSIKVDREERPDIDHIYMNVCQVLTGSGGWPLSIFMTPDKKPFYAGTYFPKEDRMGMAGFLSLLESVKNAWSENREYLTKSGNEVTKAIEDSRISGGEKKLNFNFIEAAFKVFQYEFDSFYGGFGNAPKFPTPHSLGFLLRYWYKTKNDFALKMVEKTLISMYKGGIFDHIGFGFSRYSTDRKWLVPHFEKMLYDNALLAIAFLETYQITKKEEYEKAAQQLFTYILRDMTSKEGGFYSAEDADSEGEEGKFYLWTYEEVLNILGKENGEKYCNYFNITERGNFEGKNIPNVIDTNTENEDFDFVNWCREKLFEYRNSRIHPSKDDKILTSWNGLMIAAMAIGGRVLQKSEYIEAAEKSVNFILNKLVREDGRLFARYRDEESAIPAYVDDYVFLIWGLIELYETTYKPEHLKKALELNQELLKYFWDDKDGGLFLYGSDSEQLITRPKEIYDGAIPSGNSVAAVNFIRLARLTGDYQLEEKAEILITAFSSHIKEYPKGYSFALIALMFLQEKSKEIVIVSERDDEGTKEMISVIHRDFNPFITSILYNKKHCEIEKIANISPEYRSIDGKATAYICENFQCKAPTTDIREIM